MRLTAKSEYGLLAAIDLACSYGSGPVSAREIARRRNIPLRFLEQLLVLLRRGDIVEAARGAKGGFSLTRDPELITVLAVVEALEGPLTSNVCDSEREAGCAYLGSCAAAPVWSQATSALREVFAARTLASLVGEQSTLDGATGTLEG